MDIRKRPTIKQKLKIGVVIGLGVYVVILERRRVDGLLEAAQDAILESLPVVWDDGVKYGIKLAKDLGIAAAEKSEYAFAAIDQAA